MRSRQIIVTLGVGVIICCFLIWKFAERHLQSCESVEVSTYFLGENVGKSTESNSEQQIDRLNDGYSPTIFVDQDELRSYFSNIDCSYTIFTPRVGKSSFIMVSWHPSSSSASRYFVSLYQSVARPQGGEILMLQSVHHLLGKRNIALICENGINNYRKIEEVH